MAEPRIPTMSCPECGGSPRLAEYLECGECYGTGRVTPNPLTAAEVAALPDGARVVVEWRDRLVSSCVTGGGMWFFGVEGDRSAGREYARRVWLSEDAEP